MVPADVRSDRAAGRLSLLPRGCTKVRYYGLWSPTCRRQIEHARTRLSAPPTSTHPAAPSTASWNYPTVG